MATGLTQIPSPRPRLPAIAGGGGANGRRACGGHTADRACQPLPAAAARPPCARPNIFALHGARFLTPRPMLPAWLAWERHIADGWQTGAAHACRLCRLTPPHAPPAGTVTFLACPSSSHTCSACLARSRGISNACLLPRRRCMHRRTLALCGACPRVSEPRTAIRFWPYRTATWTRPRLARTPQDAGSDAYHDLQKRPV